MGWWWLAWALAVLAVLSVYVTWLSGRVGRLHRRAEAATAALDASLVRRAAATAMLADDLAEPRPTVAAELYAAARVVLDADSPDREPAENDLTRRLRELPAELPVPPPAGWPAVVTASRRVSLARQVHTDLVRDARALRSRIPVRVLRLARQYREPAYFDVDDPGLAQIVAEAARDADPNPHPAPDAI